MLIVVSACQIVGGYESFEHGDGAPPHPCDAIKAPKTDEKRLGTLLLSKQSDGSCYWVDKTEVTVAQYRRFIAEHTDPVDWGSDQCAWKTALSNPEQDSTDTCRPTIVGEDDPFGDTKPIRCIDWCDANAFCHWAGKDLCGGNTNGGMVGPTGVIPQWDYACSKNGEQYPYGAKTIAGACNVGLSDAECYSLVHQTHCAATSVGSFPRCMSPSGAVDMIGNVSEWVLSCGFGDAGQAVDCQYRGGSFDGMLEGETCYMVRHQRRDTRDRRVGVRCCADLTVEEKLLLK